MKTDAEFTDVAVLVPCHQEERTVAGVVTAFQLALPGCRVVVCDNASADGTTAAALAAGAVVLHEPRRSKGNAVRRLFAEVEADVYVFVDGDQTYDATTAPELVAALRAGPVDMVVGRRVEDPADGGEQYRPGHRVGNALFSSAVRLLCGPGCGDLFSGYRCMSRRFVKSFAPLTRGFDIETELAVHALSLRLPLDELPAPYRSRPPGSCSKLGTYFDGLRIALRIVLLLKEHRPVLFFGGLCALLPAASLGLGIPVVLEYLDPGLVPRFPTAILSSLSQASTEVMWLA